jgi:hypothetical protein
MPPTDAFSLSATRAIARANRKGNMYRRFRRVRKGFRERGGNEFRDKAFADGFQGEFYGTL